MNEVELDSEILNNLSIELNIDENEGYWDGNDEWRKCVKINVKLMYNGKEISSDSGTIDVG